jgi:superfamily II DNA/RNA helicase
MTDSFEARGDFLPEAIAADNNDTGFNAAPDFSDALEATPTSLDAIVAEPNGFVALGLAKELLQAVADMGFTKPTAVQMATIPKAMQALDADPKATKFTDLLVSSQTGSGKTAAFLLPVLHTLLMQQEEAERFERPSLNA